MSVNYTNHLLPDDGEFFIRYGIVHTVIESELTDFDEEATGWTVWTEPVE